MTFKEWFYNAPHRTQYTKDHPTYFVAEEAWNAAHEACAKVCEERQEAFQKYYSKGLAAMCAEAIRARGNT